MKLNIITLFIALVGALAYVEHMNHAHYDGWFVEYAEPTKSDELLDFIADCEEQGLVVTPIDNDTVSCTRG